MKTRILATLLALGTLSIIAPTAAAGPTDTIHFPDVVDVNIPLICYVAELRPFSHTVVVGPVQATVTSGISQHVASGCIL